jgi:hypothetical protein
VLYYLPAAQFLHISETGVSKMVDLEALQALYEQHEMQFMGQMLLVWPALRDELLAARKDAKRYRWLRDNADEPDDAYFYLPSVWRWYSPGSGALNEQHETLDAAIDAAM